MFKFLNKLIKKNIKNETRYEYNRRLYNIGKHSYLSFNVQVLNKKETKIGKYCAIGRDALIGVSCHPIDRISIHPFTYTESCEYLYGDLVTPQEKVASNPKVKLPITIGNDVWVGARAIILDGLKIGDGAVIGTGAVVTKDVPPYAIVAGVPAKVLKYRFEQPIIDKLLELKWWNYPEDFIVNELPFEDIEKCIEVLEQNRHLCVDDITLEKQQLQAFLDKSDFADKFLLLKNKIKQKKVVIYGTGLLFDVMQKNGCFDNINVLAVSDLKYQNENITEDKGYKTVVKECIRDLKPDYVLVATKKNTNIIKELKKNELKGTRIKVLPLIKDKN